MVRPREFDENSALQEATKVFWRLGFQAATPRALMEAMELSKSSLYATFGNKRALFIRCLSHYCDQASLLLEAQLSAEDWPSAVNGFAESVIHAACDSRTGCFLYNTASELSPHDPEIEQIVIDAMHRNERIVAARLRIAQQEGQANPDLDPTVAARLVLASLAGLQVFGKANLPPTELRQVVRQLIKCLQ